MLICVNRKSATLYLPFEQDFTQGFAVHSMTCIVRSGFDHLGLKNVPLRLQELDIEFTNSRHLGRKEGGNEEVRLNRIG
jgi:hypothetical protein